MKLDQKNLFEECNKEIWYQLVFLESRLVLLNEDQLMRKPGAGGWSIAECLEHLNSYLYYYLPYLQKSFNNTNLHTETKHFTPSIPGSLMFYLIDPKRKPKKWNAHPKHHPNVISGKKSLMSHIKLQNEFKQLIDDYKSISTNQKNIPLSLAPFVKLNSGDIIQFITFHNQRHYKQIVQMMELG